MPATSPSSLPHSPRTAPEAPNPTAALRDEVRAYLATLPGVGPDVMEGLTLEAPSREEREAWAADAPRGSCPCGGLDVERAIGQTFCTCAAGHARRQRFEAALFGGAAACETPTRLRACTLASAAALPDAPGRRGALDAAGRFVAAVGEGRRPGAGLCLTGPVGTGKSGLLAAVTFALRSMGVPVAWATYAALVKAVQRGYADNSSSAVEMNLQACPVLVIDDLGDPFRTRGEVQETEDRRRIVLSVLSERTAHLRPTLISANYNTLDEMADQFDDRIADRVRESCERHTIDGASLRQSPRI